MLPDGCAMRDTTDIPFHGRWVPAAWSVVRRFVCARLRNARCTNGLASGDRMRRRSRIATVTSGLARVLVALSLVVGGLIVAAPPASAAPAWKILPIARPGAIGLDGVSCPAVNNCFAVGGTDTATSVQHWNGSRWSVMTSPNPAKSDPAWFNDVSCPSTNDCFAVGGSLPPSNSDRSLIEHWDGKRWSIMPSPNASGPGADVLIRVSCATDTSCFAVGLVTITDAKINGLLEHWNGLRWSLMTLPAPKVGTWTTDGPSSVSCFSPTDCFVVSTAYSKGNFYTFVERWNGTRWSIVASPNVTADTELSDVACPKANSCFAVGRYFTASATKTLVEHWNGTRWSIVASPNGASDSELGGVACPRANSCFAVGTSSTTSHGKTLVEHWNGARWSIMTSPTPPGSGAAGLWEVTCPNTSSCFAIGSWSKDPFGLGSTLVERYS